MCAAHRRTVLKVRQGKSQRKNRCAPTPNYYNTPQRVPAIDRCRPGAGYRHLLHKRDVERFVQLLPDWGRLSQGLNAIVLARGNWWCDGWHRPGIVAVCAWDKELWTTADAWWYKPHRAVLKQIGVSCERTNQGEWICQWTPSTARAYQLTHVLLHELGHHYDRMTTRSQRRASRGERFAERYALVHADQIWERFLNEFGLP